GDSCGDRVRGIEPLASERTIGAEPSWQTRQEPRRANVGEKTDADLRHRERELVAGNAMGAVHRDADAATHHDTVDERHIRLAIALDARAKRILLAKIAEQLIEASSAAEVIERAQIPARREGAGIARGNDHPADGGICLPFGELSRELTHHGQ